MQTKSSVRTADHCPTDRLQRHNRKLAFELEAIGPFLAPLPPEKQEAFRLQLGERASGQRDGFDAKDDKSPATIIDVLAKSKDAQEILRIVTDLSEGDEERQVSHWIASSQLRSGPPRRWH